MNNFIRDLFGCGREQLETGSKMKSAVNPSLIDLTNPVQWYTFTTGCVHVMYCITGITLI